MHSIRAEDYLKAIYYLGRSGEAAPTTAIASRLRVTAGTVTGMVKRLADRGLVEHVPYAGCRLTVAGEMDALRLVRRHRVIEAFLVQRLGFGWDRVHEEAERLEHGVSEELVARMAAVLGEPQEDPHGAPIPVPGRPFEDPGHPSLSELSAGARAVLRQVPDEDPEALRYLASLDLVPGAELRVVERTPFRGPLRIAVGERECYVGAELSTHLRVELMEPAVELARVAESDA
jgi:DtxR family Mn-dependent transcriptional regulator